MCSQQGLLPNNGDACVLKGLTFHTRKSTYSENLVANIILASACLENLVANIMHCRIKDKGEEIKLQKFIIKRQ